jgi:hypothetical protein
MLESKLEEITKKLQTLHSENSDNADADALIGLINLQSSITAKKAVLEKRLSKLKGKNTDRYREPTLFQSKIYLLCLKHLKAITTTPRSESIVSIKLF